MNYASDEKFSTFLIVSLFQGTDSSPTDPDPENAVGDHDAGSPGRPVYSGLKVPGERDIDVQGERRLGELPEWFLFQNAFQLHQQR